MKLLFITTFGQSILKEHIFTRNLWYALRKDSSAELMTIFEGEDDVKYEYDSANRWHKLYIPSAILKSKDETEAIVARFFREIAPDIIHSNMIETFEIKAAASQNIPIVLTIHIGAIVCPRGGGNGFLKWDDTICDGPIGANCRKCCCYELPFPKLANFIDRVIPRRVGQWLQKKTEGKQIFYLRPLLSISKNINERLEAIEVLKKATIITANRRLSGLLNNLGIKTAVIRHGIKSFQRYEYPIVGETTPVRFYFLGRIQYSKGLHVLLEAFEGIPVDQYELHIFGDAYPARREQRYKKRILKLAKGKNVIFHGFVENDELPELLKDMHVMIHPAIFHEVYGINISESLSFGHPVLATKCGGPEMQIEDKVNGWLVSPNNTEELREKIRHILEHKSSLGKISDNCHCPNSLEDYILQLSELYHKICDK